MKILVTGAGGFVGKRLVKHLAASGHSVIAMARRSPAPEDAEYFSSPNVSVILHDLASLDVSALPPGIEAVFTLAQSSRFRDFPEGTDDVLAVNVTANVKLFQWARQTGVKRFIHVSSGGIYGGGSNSVKREEALFAVDSPLGFYLGSRLCGEILFQSFTGFFETAVILRPFFIYGAGQRKDMFVTRIIESVASGAPVTLHGHDGLKTNPVYVDDAVWAFAASLNLSGCHVLNIGGPDVLSLRALSSAVGKSVGREPVFSVVDKEAVDYVGDISNARMKLGFVPMGFENGLKLTLPR